MVLGGDVLRGWSRGVRAKVVDVSEVRGVVWGWVRGVIVWGSVVLVVLTGGVVGVASVVWVVFVVLAASVICRVATAMSVKSSGW